MGTQPWFCVADRDLGNGVPGFKRLAASIPVESTLPLDFIFLLTSTIRPGDVKDFVKKVKQEDARIEMRKKQLVKTAERIAQARAKAAAAAAQTPSPPKPTNTATPETPSTPRPISSTPTPTLHHPLPAKPGTSPPKPPTPAQPEPIPVTAPVLPPVVAVTPAPEPVVLPPDDQIAKYEEVCFIHPSCDGGAN